MSTSENIGQDSKFFEVVTLRDYFAAKAMQAEMMLDESRAHSEVAELAYEMADAMMGARKSE